MTVREPSGATMEALAYHGGDVSAAARLFPDAPEPWIDLSTGINPHPYPLPPIPPEAWTRLPDRAALAKLQAAAATFYGAPQEADIVPAPGSQAIIQGLSRLLPAARVGILAPTYRGHARAWGDRCENVARPEALADFDVAIVVNPNNPDGRVTPGAELLALADRMAARGGWLIVDEAFADFDARADSLAPCLPEAGAIVLRSFGKTWGLAGSRLGFALAPSKIAGALRSSLGPWAVSGPAIEIGARALADVAWFDASRARLATEAARLDGLLIRAGWRVIGGTRLFRLAAKPDATRRFHDLLRAGILTRPFDDAPDRLRFGLPGDESGWERLSEALVD